MLPSSWVMVISYSLTLTVHRIYVIWTSILCSYHFLEWFINPIFQMIIRLPTPMSLTSKVSTTVILGGYLRGFLHAALLYPFHLVFVIPSSWFLFALSPPAFFQRCAFVQSLGAAWSILSSHLPYFFCTTFGHITEM